MDAPRDRATEERAATHIRAVAAGVGAPAGLRAAVAQERLRRAPARPPERRSRALVPAAAAALAACAAIGLVLAEPAATPGGSVAAAARVALRPPTAPPPRIAADGHLRLAVGGVAFPAGARAAGWQAIGTRTDRVAGRRAVTVVYARGAQRIGYTIVDGRPLAIATGARRISYEGTSVAAGGDSTARYITWRRSGRTCVLATRGAALAPLLEFAARS